MWTALFNAFANPKDKDAISRHVPKDTNIIDQYDSDLNQDGLNDKILVLADKKEDAITSSSNSPHRTLLILFGAGNGFVKTAETDKVFYCKTCGGAIGDPYVGIVVKPPYFTIEHYGGSTWRWQQYITFKYSAKDRTFLLHKNGHTTFNALSPDQVETKIQTKKDFGIVKIHDFDIYKE